MYRSLQQWLDRHINELAEQVYEEPHTDEYREGYQDGLVDLFVDAKLWIKGFETSFGHDASVESVMAQLPESLRP